MGNANARLIALAPKMAKVLIKLEAQARYVEHQFENVSGHGLQNLLNLANEVRALLARLEGGGQ